MNIDKSLFKKQFLLTGLGVFFQILSGVCFCAATVMTLKDTRRLLRRHLAEALRDEM